MIKKDPKKIGQRIRAARKAAGLSQRELGERDGITSAYVSRLEKGHRVPSLDALADVGAALGTTGLVLWAGGDAHTCPFCGREP